MKNIYCEREGNELEGFEFTQASYCYLDLGCLMNMVNDMKDELDRRRRSVCAAFGCLQEAIHGSHPLTILFHSTVLPALC